MHDEHEYCNNKEQHWMINKNDHEQQTTITTNNKEQTRITNKDNNIQQTANKNNNWQPTTNNKQKEQHALTSIATVITNNKQTWQQTSKK